MKKSPEAVHRKPIGSESKLWTVNIKIQLFKILKAKNINGREIYPAPVMFQALVKLYIITLPLEFWSSLDPSYNSTQGMSPSIHLISPVLWSPFSFTFPSTLCSSLPIFHFFIQISILEEPSKVPLTWKLAISNLHSILRHPTSISYSLRSLPAATKNSASGSLASSPSSRMWSFLETRKSLMILSHPSDPLYSRELGSFHISSPPLQKHPQFWK